MENIKKYFLQWWCLGMQLTYLFEESVKYSYEK